MKKIITLTASAILAVMIFIFPVFAQSIPEERQLPLLVDDASLLTASEKAELLELLTDLSEKTECDIAVVTAESLGGKSPMAFADDFFDYNGYGYGENDNGIMLVLALESRDYWITTHGKAYDNISSSEIEDIEDAVVPYLSSGDYYTAFAEFANESSKLVNGHIFGLVDIVIALAVGVLIAFISVSVMKGKLKSVRAQSGASVYMKAGSLNLTRSHDIFLYHTVTRVPRPKESSGGGGGHTSSSGRSHGGGGGKF